MKSALEIALEKSAKLMEGEPAQARLTDEQRAKIAAIEQEYRAKAAEQEIMVESKIKTVALQATGREFSEQVMLLREQLTQEKMKLEEEKQARIQAIRESNA
ncbi:MAG: hypothetical protein HY710_14095 [Candidatus Latescibacteria bacterium]|nr:hypothetical protein [Candidatus Latescibacterota bacterium]